MDYSLFFNNLSVPARSANEAYSLLLDAFHGVLSINSSTSNRFFLHFDFDEADEMILSGDFKYSNFKSKLRDENEMELLSFILEIEDKSPFLDFVNEENINELTELSIYIDGQPYANMDIFGQAFLSGGTMLSLATNAVWADGSIRFNILRTGEHRAISAQLPNISKAEHGDLIAALRERRLEDIGPNIFFTDLFRDWYQSCSAEDKSKILSILQHCYAHDFELGRPTIDTIEHSRFQNMKEIRAGNAHAQNGKIRLLFARSPNRISNILVGFIKHSNDYTAPIRMADREFETILSGMA